VKSEKNTITIKVPLLIPSATILEKVQARKECENTLLSTDFKKELTANKAKATLEVTSVARKFKS
jgi:hypothetical protein